MLLKVQLIKASDSATQLSEAVQKGQLRIEELEAQVSSLSSALCEEEADKALRVQAHQQQVGCRDGQVHCIRYIH